MATAAAITGMPLRANSLEDSFNLLPTPGGPAGQLYDLARDPGELHNLYQARPEIVDRLATLLEQYKWQGYTRVQ
jgi:hypothetical protein